MPIASLAESIEKMQKSVEKLASNQEKFFVVSQDVDSYRQEQSAAHEEMLQLLKRPDDERD